MNEASIGQASAAGGRPAPFFLSPHQHGIVVFRILPALPYTARATTSFALVIAGLLAQFWTASFWAGAPLLLAGSLLMCVKGYNNLVESGRFSPSDTWEKVDTAQLNQLLDMDRKILRWNRSLMDVTNGFGVCTFVLLLAPTAILALHHYADGHGLLPWEWETLLFNAALLLLPHWVTGVRRILRLPKLMVKTETLKPILDHAETHLEPDEISLLMQLNGKKKLPDDLKMQVRPKGAPEDLYGLYVQVVTNDVNGTSFPYLYVVLVARDGFGLKRFHEELKLPKNIIKEFKKQSDVEIIVIRQHTTKTSGYHTHAAQALAIFNCGLKLVDRVVSAQ